MHAYIGAFHCGKCTMGQAQDLLSKARARAQRGIAVEVDCPTLLWTSCPTADMLLADTYIKGKLTTTSHLLHSGAHDRARAEQVVVKIPVPQQAGGRCSTWSSTYEQDPLIGPAVQGLPACLGAAPGYGPPRAMQMTFCPAKGAAVPLLEPPHDLPVDLFVPEQLQEGPWGVLLHPQLLALCQKQESEHPACRSCAVGEASSVQMPALTQNATPARRPDG